MNFSGDFEEVEKLANQLDDGKCDITLSNVHETLVQTSEKGLQFTPTMENVLEIIDS